MTREKEFTLLRGDVCDVTRFGSDVQHRRAHGQNVVDLARVNNAYKLFTHDDDVQIRRGQRTGKLIEWLIRQTLYVAQPGLTYLQLLASAAYETEHDLGSRFECACSFEQRVEWMTRAVVTGIHHHKLVRE